MRLCSRRTAIETAIRGGMPTASPYSPTVCTPTAASATHNAIRMTPSPPM